MFYKCINLMGALFFGGEYASFRLFFDKESISFFFSDEGQLNLIFKISNLVSF